LEIIWLGGQTNQKIAAYFKAKGYIDDYEANQVSTVLIINREKVVIPFVAFEDAIGKIYPKDYMLQLWKGLFLNIRGGKLEKIDENEAVLVETVEKRVLSLRIPKDLYNKIKEKAEKEGKTMTDIVLQKLNDIKHPC